MNLQNNLVLPRYIDIEYVQSDKQLVLSKKSVDFNANNLYEF